MRRREFIGLLGASAALPFAAVAQQAGRTYRLGVLLPLTQHAPINAAFLDELRRGVFIEGQNLGVEWRAFAEHFDRMSLYAAELVKARVDVIATATDEAIRALRQITKTIPIVAITDDLLGSGFVNSVARPDGNITGINILGREGNGKRQDILIEAVPGLRRMAVLADVTTAPPLDVLREGARAHSVELSIYPIARGDEIAAAIDKSKASGATALNVTSSGLFYANRQLIRDRATALHLPAIFPWPEEAEEGAFAAYGPSLNTLFVEMMPQHVMKLFRGAKVADIPIEQPTKFKLVFNLKTANAIGVEVLPSILLRADKVIE
jgi:putative ABC transport system substrate-binding protein